MYGVLVVALMLVVVWGSAAIGWAAALKVSRREGASYFAVLLDRPSWMGERVWGVRAGPLILTWLSLGFVVLALVMFWRP